MKITFYLKDHGIGALDLNRLNQLWHLLKPKEGREDSPLLQYPQLVQLEDFLLLLQHGYLKVKREGEGHPKGNLHNQVPIFGRSSPNKLSS